jgi:CheY-like chemotaxis protein
MPNSTEKKRILEVCDQAGLREITTIVCQRMGFEVVEAACGDEAIVLYRERGPFDLVSTDWLYFDGVTEPPPSKTDTLWDGIQFAEAIRDIKPDQRVAMHTASWPLQLSGRLADVPVLKRGGEEFFGELRALLNSL